MDSEYEIIIFENNEVWGTYPCTTAEQAVHKFIEKCSIYIQYEPYFGKTKKSIYYYERSHTARTIMLIGTISADMIDTIQLQVVFTRST